jgi:hypothetical protein
MKAVDSESHRPYEKPAVHRLGQQIGRICSKRSRQITVELDSDLRGQVEDHQNVGQGTLHSNYSSTRHLEVPGLETWVSSVLGDKSPVVLVVKRCANGLGRTLPQHGTASIHSLVAADGPSLWHVLRKVEVQEHTP